MIELDSLNIPQKEAVLHNEGPLLVLAGAGSGKTRVLTHKAAHLSLHNNISLNQMLIVTFTNKAAQEMSHRIHHLLGLQKTSFNDRPWISTFHSACTRILRVEIDHLGYDTQFQIYDTSDQLTLIKKIISDLGLDEKIYPPKVILSRISRAKMMGWNASDIEKQPQFIMDQRSLNIFKQYDSELKRANALDFDDLLLKTYQLFLSHPDILSIYQNQFKYLMVDEYQDTNHIQYLLLKLLAKKHRNICVVGDEDQSIYSWRGADISNILSFEKDFPECHIIKLEKNYRSTKNIVLATSHLIQNNQLRKGKTLFTDNQNGDLIKIKEENDEYSEAKYVVHQIEKQKVNGLPYSDMAIFYRTNAQSRALEDQLRSFSIPYKLIGGLKFYERMEIKDIISYMRITLNSEDDLSFRRIINRPARGIGKTTLEKIEEIATIQQLSLFKAAQKVIAEGSLNSGSTKKVNHFIQLVQNLNSSAKNEGPREHFHHILNQTGYSETLKMEVSIEAQSRLENLKELDNALLQFEKERGDEATLSSFLEEIALVSDQAVSDNADSVTLMTLHVSKGLEFPVVFIVGMEEGIFPGYQAINSTEEDETEEERRLAYVGMTRAKQKLFLTYCKSRRIWGQLRSHLPSRFLEELPKELISHEYLFSEPTQRNQFFSSNKSKYKNSTTTENGTDHDHQIIYDQESSHDDDELQYKKGMRVRHPSYGLGHISQIEGEGTWQKISVLFKDHSLKKFVAKYARLEIVP